MKVYLRKVDNQCINNRRISITKGILKHFFDNASNQDEVDMRGILSNYNDKVSILLATVLDLVEEFIESSVQKKIK